jgi:hypothetical protein
VGAEDGVVAEMLRGGTVLADTMAKPDVHWRGLSMGGALSTALEQGRGRGSGRRVEEQRRSGRLQTKAAWSGLGCLDRRDFNQHAQPTVLGVQDLDMSK